MKKRYTAGTQKHVHGVIIFKEFNSNIYQILSFTPFNELLKKYRTRRYIIIEMVLILGNSEITLRFQKHGKFQ